MNLVSWNSAIQIKKRCHRPTVREPDKLWCEIVRPARYEDLIGNEKAIRETEDWFRLASSNPRASSCLFVHGESGTGKSTAVSMVAKKFNFEPVTTYADQSRTPARLEGVVREAGIHGNRGVVVLDDFEIFLSETTSLRVLSKLLRQLLGVGNGNGNHGNNGNRSRCLFVIISNSKHKFFGSLQDISTTVGFERLEQREMYKIFNRLAARVSRHAYVPPMASYLSSISSSGTITQGVQQLQLMYAGTEMPTLDHRPKKKQKQKQKQKKEKQKHTNQTSLALNQSVKNRRDCVSYLWSDIYTDKILEMLVDDKFQRGRVVDRLVGFEKGRLDAVGAQLHDEYARRMMSMERLRDVAEDLSMSDCHRAELHEDALYDGENRQSWSANDISYIAYVARGVVAIKGQPRRDQFRSRKPHTRLLKCDQLIF